MLYIQLQHKEKEAYLEVEIWNQNAFSPQEKARVVVEYIRNQSATRIQRLRVTLSYNGTLDSSKAQIFLVEVAMEEPVQVNKQ